MTRHELEAALRLGAAFILEPVGNPVGFVLRLEGGDAQAELRTRGVNTGFLTGLRGSALEGFRVFMGAPLPPETQLLKVCNAKVFEWLDLRNA